MRPRRFRGGSDPVEAGLVESLARPGGNITGITNLARELAGKRLELLKEAITKLVRVAVLYDSANSNDIVEVKELLPADVRALKLIASAQASKTAASLNNGFGLPLDSWSQSSSN
jgi:putative ABC transport system substrate-binding protein